ncbi:hypothetical protein EMIHUDRAFT_194023 [Emiliania huxleyi CCMP1516]|uniref:CBS domain-containing protein n=2 Tax=Emiliania huxleyi TaxID=2903 RepID=A0A0D3L0U4_EMIH1|nr:hypothetical protein EMIHUDRAFT_194023 [Emiliania huxleyi CCMP1516]EOD41629.1 hypothetical protein EMIHUDRAFT_194023 [Emiliania huxleyi CCMP1516]|eukprot:XP_005794058.1 hypothetical protein EMIHUDRAFT_194023 [Emiliania huxleyi CCMP1516]
MLFAFWAVGPSWLPSAPTGAPQTRRASRASRSSAARALAKSAAEPSGDHAEPCNVVLTHTNTDFDSLAAAVALARLWSYQRPEVPTHVVMPRGVNPLVARFLAYHKHLLPVRGFSTINPSDLRAVGVVDTQTRERLGPAARWLDCASYVAVYDHHVDNTPNIQHDELVIEPVGSATTVLATLFALGIRADTGALSYPDTTARDGHALAGASQHAIAEFGHARLSAAQRDVLSTALAQTERYRDVMKAAQASKGGQRVKSWVRRHTLTVPTQTPLDELEAILIEQSAGRLPVVADDGTLVGLVTRTDVLRQRNLYTTEGLERSRASLSPPRGAGTAAGSGHAS